MVQQKRYQRLLRLKTSKYNYKSLMSEKTFLKVQKMGKSHYIYLNEYPNGYLYVGSHTWNGNDGELDLSYLGSSAIARNMGWVPIKVTLLESVQNDRKLIAEREWILRYCRKYGCAPQVKRIDPLWFSNFGEGLMLNCHSNSAEPILRKEVRERAHKTFVENGGFVKFMEASRTPEVVKKSLNTRIATGGLLRWSRAGCEAARTPEAVRKSIQVRKETGGLARAVEAARTSEVSKKRFKSFIESGGLDRWVKSVNSEEARNKRQKTLLETEYWKFNLAKTKTPEVISKYNYKAIHLKGQQTRKSLGIKPKFKKVALFKGSEFMEVGYCGRVCELAGNRNWSIDVGSKFLKGNCVVVRDGFTFVLLETEIPIREFNKMGYADKAEKVSEIIRSQEISL